MPIEAFRNLPRLAITMGDAAGIGPEVVTKSLASGEVTSVCRPVVIGSLSVLAETALTLKLPLQFCQVTMDNLNPSVPTAIPVLDTGKLKSEDVIIGRVSAKCGEAAMEYIATATRLMQKHLTQALVTAPINKEATRAAGYEALGHLEYLAKLTGTDDYATMLASGSLRVVHLSTHYSLADACRMVTQKRILERLKLAHHSFKQWGLDHPRLGVAALNPHGGEGGIMGTEEMTEISPAVAAACEAGINARGPYPADSIFNRALAGEFDAVLAMYHDQGHIPVKVHGFEKSVSIAMGLPFIRTSVDHGTAYDIAGRGIADPTGLIEAIRTAVNLVNRQGLGGAFPAPASANQ